MTNVQPGVATAVESLLRIGDDALIMAQRLSWWCSRAPAMEEDVALANIALDQLGVARQVLAYAGELTGTDEDGLAYGRDAHQYRNCLLVELPDHDFARTMTKLLFVSAYQYLLYGQLAGEPDGGPAGGRLAAVAGKAVKESAYHLDHATVWTLRLGDGTAESHRRMQTAIDELWPYTSELFEPDRRGLQPAWLATVGPVLAQATLRQPADAAAIGPAGRGAMSGRVGRHTPKLAELLAEMQVVHRAHPGATW